MQFPSSEQSTNDTNAVQACCGAALVALTSPNTVPLVPQARLTGCLASADICQPVRESGKAL